MSGQNVFPYFDPCYWKRYMVQYDTILEDVYDTIWHNIGRGI